MAKTPTKPNRTSKARASARGSAVAAQNLGSISSRPKPKSSSSFHMPLDLIEKAKTWGYKTFPALRRRLNKELAKHPEFLASPYGTKRSVAEMTKGRNPYAREKDARGKNKKMNYDHHVEQQRIRAAYKGQPKKVQNGVTNVANLTMRSPNSHVRKLSHKFDTSAGTPVAGHSRFATNARKVVQKPQVPTKPAVAAPRPQKSPMAAFKKR